METNNKNSTVHSCPLRSGQEEILVDFVSGSLDGNRAARFAEHMQQCDACVEWVAAQEAVWARLDEFAAEPVSAEFNRNLYTKISASEKEPWYAQLAARVKAWLEEEVTLRPAVSVAVACGVLLMAGVALQQPWKRGAAGAGLVISDARLNPDEVAQAERALEDLELLQQWQEEPADGKKQ